MQEFCTRPSRLFSGEPGALFTPDSGRFTVSDILTAPLSSPFQFQLNSNQAPDGFIWHVTKCNVSIYSPGGIANFETGPNAGRLFLNPNNNVGSNFTTNGAVSGIVPQNVGVEIRKISSDQVNGPFPQGWYTYKFDAPFDIPPKWFLSFVILDSNGGPNLLTTGSVISIDTVRQQIPRDFYKN
jgi:hypothetical protein